jgi:hypothetical protein
LLQRGHRRGFVARYPEPGELQKSEVGAGLAVARVTRRFDVFGAFGDVARDAFAPQ